jgi:NADH-quinone oxidoreductase subunit N
MIDKLWFLIPEMIVFAGVVAVSIMGLSPVKRLRDAVPLTTAMFLLAAAIVNPLLYTEERIALAEGGLLMPMLGLYAKTLVPAVGVLLTMLAVGLIDRRYEGLIEAGRVKFDPLRVNRGEFFVFFLLSLMGVMLIAQANDLIWLFLALELASLPTYVMVAVSRPSPRAQEAAVKYFFLGAMATAVFLYGFALLYGASGTVVLTEMRAVFAAQAATEQGINFVGIVGMIVAVLGVSFKIAAAPMHFYVADVYEGAASAVTAFLAFVPKAAGMLALILLLSTVGWSGHGEALGLPIPIAIALVTICALTMLLGNVGALLQRSVKRMLAYSSIAHAGYVLIGVVAMFSEAVRVEAVSAVLYYLAAYTVSNVLAFGSLIALGSHGREAVDYQDLAGAGRRHPLLALPFILGVLSLMGFPPTAGFLGKWYVFSAALGAGDQLVWLVVLGVLTSVIAAFYYLRVIVFLFMKGPEEGQAIAVPMRSAYVVVALVVSGVLVLQLGVLPAEVIDLALAAAKSLS